MDYRRCVEYGKFLRSFVDEPVSSLVRQEDLAYCASRLLLLQQFVRLEDRALSDMIGTALQELASLNPESAIQRVRAGRQHWETSPVYWALCCHVLAHTLSEFSGEAAPATVTDLRQSLGDWFPRFRHSMEGRGATHDEKHLVCLQCYLVQSAIFHDTHAMIWCKDKMLALLTPERMNSEVALECGAMLAGLFSRGDDASSRGQLAVLFDQAASQSAVAKEARDALSDIIPSRPGHVISSPSHGQHSSVPRMETRQPQVKKKKRETMKKKGGGRAMEQLGTIAIWGVIILLFAGCIYGMGRFYDFFESSSNVGQVSLKDWYENTEDGKGHGMIAKQREAAEQDQIAAATPPNGEISPVEAIPVVPNAPPATNQPSAGMPPPQPDAKTHFESYLPALEKTLASRVVVPRRVAVQGGMPGEIKSMHGVYDSVWTYGAGSGSIGGGPVSYRAQAAFIVNWFENGQPKGQQTIEARYDWNGQSWIIRDAVRNTSPPNSQNRDAGRVTDPSDMQWAKSLFEANPFYQ